MAEDRVTEPPHTTVIERRGGGGGILIGLALLIAVVVGALFLYNQGRNDTVRTDAVTQAAKDVGDSAKQAGTAAEKATE